MFIAVVAVLCVQARCIRVVSQLAHQVVQYQPAEFFIICNGCLYNLHISVPCGMWRMVVGYLAGKHF